MRKVLAYALVAACAAETSHQHRRLHAKRYSRFLTENDFHALAVTTEGGNPVPLPADTENVVYEFEQCSGFGLEKVCRPISREDAAKCPEGAECHLETDVSALGQPKEAPAPSVAVPEFSISEGGPQSAQLPPQASSAPPSPPPPPPPSPPPASTQAEEPVPPPATQSSSSSAPAPAPHAETAPVPVSPPAPVAAPSGNGQCPGLDCEFPSGELPCSAFPDGFGAVRTYWQNNGGWSGIQRVPDYKPNSAISFIETGIDNKAGPNTFLSYACPPSYTKTQWPEEQGDKGQTVGGLLCNADNKLELTRKSIKTLCQKGVGGIYAENKFSDKNITICQTDYPGTEKMVIATVVGPGQRVELFNPDQTTFLWTGKKTSAQYYLNRAGLNVDEACVWDSPGDLKDKAGDKAPVILGVGFDPDSGQTFSSVFSNNKNALIGYKIDMVKGNQDGGNALCHYEDAAPGAVAPGCTASVPKDGAATFVFSP